jgi:hypothetical protein
MPAARDSNRSARFRCDADFPHDQCGGGHWHNDYYNQRTEAHAATGGYVLGNYDRDVICLLRARLWLVGPQRRRGGRVVARQFRHAWQPRARPQLGLNRKFLGHLQQSIIGPARASIRRQLDTMGSASAGNNHFNARYKII